METHQQPVCSLPGNSSFTIDNAVNRIRKSVLNKEWVVSFRNYRMCSAFAKALFQQLTTMEQFSNVVAIDLVENYIGDATVEDIKDMLNSLRNLPNVYVRFGWEISFSTFNQAMADFPDLSERVSRATPWDNDDRKMFFEQDAILSKRLNSLTKTVENLNGYTKNRDKAIELDVNIAMQVYLEKEGYININDITSNMSKPIRENGGPLFQWDGVLICSKTEKQYLVLIETKSSVPLPYNKQQKKLDIRKIEKMKKDDRSYLQEILLRKDLTERYMKKEVDIKSNNIGKSGFNENVLIARCFQDNWASLEGSDIILVIGSPVFAPKTKEWFLSNGVYICHLQEDIFKVVAPSN